MSEPMPQATPDARPLVWPWVLGAILLVLFAAPAVFLGGFVISSLADRQFEASDTTLAENAVLAFDGAYRDADCDAFEAVTTPGFRDDLLGGHYRCSDWQATAGELVDGGEYNYRVRVTSSYLDGGSAFVSTSESYGASASADFVYELDQRDGVWVITDYYED